MRVVDLLNVLTRFPGKTEIEIGNGTITVGGVSVLQDGKLASFAKGTKGTGIAAQARPPRTRGRSRSTEDTE